MLCISVYICAEAVHGASRSLETVTVVVVRSGLVPLLPSAKLRPAAATGEALKH